MGLSGALYSGISGLERNQTQLDVIGNNISNVNTYGYKSQRVLFQDILYNTMRPGTAPVGTNAGTNPSQVGGGVDISQISTDFSDGDIETTGISSDMAIEGNGFFVLKDGVNQVYTRDGAFSLNQERKLVNGATGMVVQGWVQSRDNAGNSTVNTGGAITDITIPVGDNRIAKATSEVVLNGNLNNAGTIASTGTILNSQRLFTSTTDTEVASGAVDLRDVYIKDPAGGVDNIRLFKGSGTSGTSNNVLTGGDQITIQLMKGGRPLEAIFVYGNNDLVDNVTGNKQPDFVPDAGLESYDGTTLDDFLKWFDQAFGLIAVEDAGASAASNAAHGVDGDNPNDLVDMGKDTTLPFTDETDGSGFELVMSKKIENLQGNTALTTPTGPKAAVVGGTKQFNILAGSNGDVTTGSSYVDIDEDGAFNKEKDIVLEGVESYVVTGNSTVTKGGQASGSTDQLVLRSMQITSATGSNVIISDKSDMYIDKDASGQFTKGVDTVVKGAFSTNIFGNTTTDGDGTDVNGKMTLTFTIATGNNTSMSATTVTKGMSILGNVNTTTRYFVESVDTSTSGKITVTFDKAKVTTDFSTGGALATVAFQGAALVAAGYTATSSSGVGSTLVSNLNAPVGKLNATTGKYEGKSITETLADNEKGMAGSQFIDGDATVRVVTAPVLAASTGAAANDGTSGMMTLTLSAATGIKTGMAVVGDVSGTKYTVDRIVGNVIHFDKARSTTDFNAQADSILFSGFSYLDVDGDGAHDETVYRVRNSKVDTAATSGSLFIDIAGAGDAASTTALTISTTSTNNNLASYGDNAIVFKDANTGNVYRKVPSAYDPDNNLVYIDKMTKGTFDEQRYDVTAASALVTPTGIADGTANDGNLELTVSAADAAKLSTGMVVTANSKEYTVTNINGTTVTVNLGATTEAAADFTASRMVTFYNKQWTIDESHSGTIDYNEDLIVSTQSLASMSGDTATLNMPTSNSVDGVKAKSGSIQMRGQIGSVNNITDISFISGVDKVERNIFGPSALADTSGNGYSIEKTSDGESVTQNIVVYDSLGKSHDVNMTFVLESKDNDKAVWRWYAETADASRKNGIFPVGDPRGLTPAVNVGTGVVHFDNFGRFLTSDPVQPLISIPIEGQDTDSALNIKPDFSILTAFAETSGSQVDVREQDGFAQGVMDRYSVNADGTITGIYTNGMTETVAQVALAAFANPSGLTRTGANLFTVGSNSGNAMIGEALTGERGAIRGESLESSNVDITDEFTDMITTQRAYQANARVITKADELLQELMSIIR